MTFAARTWGRMSVTARLTAILVPLAVLLALGTVVGELFDFDRLAERCADDGRWTFLFLSVPLNLQGGVGTPANAVVIR